MENNKELDQIYSPIQTSHSVKNLLKVSFVISIFPVRGAREYCARNCFMASMSVLDKEWVVQYSLQQPGGT